METKRKKLPVGARERVPKWAYPAWSTGSVVMAVSTAILGYTTFYCTDILGLKVGIVGIIMMISRLTDGVTDLLVGYLVDNTHSKWGKARPYEVTIALLWLFIALLFSTPKMGETATIIWAFIMYFMATAVCQTLVWGADSAYIVNAFKRPEDRNKAISVSGILIMVVSTVVAIILPQFVEAAGTSRAMWSKMAVCVAVPCAIIGLLRVVLIPEYNVEETCKKAERISAKVMLKNMVKNKYLIIFTIIYFIYMFCNNTGVGVYFYKYYIENIGLQSLTSLSMLLAPVFLIVFPIMIGKVGSAKVLVLGEVFAVLSPLVRIIGGKSTAGLMVSSILGAVAMVPVAMLVDVYRMECMDYGEWKTGVRLEAIMGSLTSFASKTASGFAAVVAGFVLDAAHYDGTLAVQPTSAIHAILFLQNYLPLILGVVALILAAQYKLGNQMPQIRKDLAERHTKGSDTAPQ